MQIRTIKISVDYIIIVCYTLIPNRLHSNLLLLHLYSGIVKINGKNIAICYAIRLRQFTVVKYYYT